jgi:hypothetical protein
MLCRGSRRGGHRCRYSRRLLKLALPRSACRDARSAPRARTSYAARCSLTTCRAGRAARAKNWNAQAAGEYARLLFR